MQKYRVNEIYPAIQGEGFYTGHPCVIVRLQGCNEGCPFCDTPDAQSMTGGHLMDVEVIAKIIRTLLMPNGFCLLTGGEPGLQDLADFVEVIRQIADIHIETNGTQPICYEFAWITLSPKSQPCLPNIVARTQDAGELKWLIGDVGSLKKLEAFLKGWNYTGKVCVQPIFGSIKAARLAYDCALERGWNLSLQTHKMIGVK